MELMPLICKSGFRITPSIVDSYCDYEEDYAEEHDLERISKDLRRTLWIEFIKSLGGSETDALELICWCFRLK